jgi:hypothetical protein
VDGLEGGADAGFEDARDGFASVSYGGFFFEEGDEGVLRVACDEEGIVAGELLAEGGKAVFD